ncbi:DUF3135 domain-containing protein [Vibrio aestuarianus]|uniref:DUF3135 domain-containing protein n=1 Tax=Vibrio aestuarianus TaxID=28171 RepID=UPI001559B4C1|nr:DUF3135 domain-containing protein [Vibrio aestuarianus]NGZ12473.1 DUF3135 domain-containing protein [Vibrio aestuarianus]NKZ48621.1 DUF3135 domain-containing protein [Vibrio aestuarianus]
MVPPQKQALPSFDELVELAQHNPEAFTQLKKDICEELILSASFNMQDRLWAQQSHIDLVVSQCKNPIHTNVTLMRELSQQMIKFQNALDGESEKEKVSAEIVPFTPRDNGWR